MPALDRAAFPQLLWEKAAECNRDHYLFFALQDRAGSPLMCKYDEDTFDDNMYIMAVDGKVNFSQEHLDELLEEFAVKPQLLKETCEERTLLTCLRRFRDEGVTVHHVTSHHNPRKGWTEYTIVYEVDLTGLFHTVTEPKQL